MYQTDFTKSFQKQFHKLPKKSQNKFLDRLQVFLQDQSHPLLRTHELTGRWKGYASFNVTADIRAIFILKENTFLFVAIGSHSQLYG